MRGPRAVLRDARYALPRAIGRVVAGPGPAAAARRCLGLNRHGLGATVGYFQADAGGPEEILAANLAVASLFRGRPGDVHLSLKAPPLGFDATSIRRVAEAADAAGLAVIFDAHGLDHAAPTLAAASALLRDFPRTGIVLPARWRRSLQDAADFRETTARIRLVKGEWADPDWGEAEVAANYLALVARLAGRAAPVAVATHDPALAERALTLLLAAGTPCELEQLRGLPGRRTRAVARRLGVPVRIYVPFGPGWWPYAVDKALARPYLLAWLIRDWFGRPGRPARPKKTPGIRAPSR
jgi:proline dehydrogenase